MSDKIQPGTEQHATEQAATEVVPKKSNLRVAIVPVTIALAFATGYVLKQIFLG